MLNLAPMKTLDAKQHFGTAAAVARAAGISKAAVSQWGEIVPLASAAKLREASGNKLKVRLEDYRKDRAA